MSKATSYSDRLSAAQHALHEHDKVSAFTAPEDREERAQNLAAALRSMIEAAETEEGPEAIGRAIYLGWLNDNDDHRREEALIVAGVQAGINAAWCSWEPDDYAPEPEEEPIAVYVIQSDTGEIVDVTTNREWAEWQTRTDDDNPVRSLHEDTLWAGPEDRSEWGEIEQLNDLPGFEGTNAALDGIVFRMSRGAL